MEQNEIKRRFHKRGYAIEGAATRFGPGRSYHRANAVYGFDRPAATGRGGAGIGVLEEESQASPLVRFGGELIEAIDYRFYGVFKRTIDVVVSVCALAFFALILPILALAIKIDSPGPIFFTQERVGMNRRRRRSRFGNDDRRKVMQPGRPFKIIKLRTMRTDAEKEGPKWAEKNDPRITRVGAILRKTRLDEIPQVINVLRGEMSVIGPRPERLHFVRQFEREIPEYHERLRILPGITGLAQILNGYDESSESVRRKVELDRIYIERSGILADLMILLGTVRVILKGEGAH
jgi:lipopolysaccharide/colanic/teichoic acid biosynthesis glycosyltransferase